MFSPFQNAIELDKIKKQHSDGRRPHRRRPVEQLHGHGAVRGVRVFGRRAGPTQLHRAVRRPRPHAQSGRPEHVQADDSQGQAARLRVPRAGAVVQHLCVAQAGLVRRLRRHARRGHRRQLNCHMDSGRYVEA